MDLLKAWEETENIVIWFLTAAVKESLKEIISVGNFQQNEKRNVNR